MVFVRRLRWDAWNVTHIARHSVVPEEVEEVCHGDPLAQQTYSRRLVLIGPTATGRMLAVVLAPMGRGVYYPVTARPASRKERGLYRQEKRGSQP
ncbi:MAG TPA: BrnT family toxin [Chloroflexota bacterium]|nr:BrnT family toxin [Chloroflexota bacterium]